MPRIRALNTYSNEYWEIVEACAVRQEEFTFEVPTITVGLSMQGKFYSFRGALKREVQRAALFPQEFTPTQAKRNADALQWAEATICWVDRKHVPSVVKFCHKDQHPTSVLLRKVLATRTQTPLPAVTQEQLRESAQRALVRQQQDEEDPTGGKYG